MYIVYTRIVIAGSWIFKIPMCLGVPRTYIVVAGRITIKP